MSSCAFGQAPWRLQNVSSSSGKSLTIALWIKAGAKRNSLCGIVDGKLGMQISAPAREGEANDQVIGFLAEILHLKRRNLAIVSGLHSRDKVVKFDLNELDWETVQDLPARLENALKEQ